MNAKGDPVANFLAPAAASANAGSRLSEEHSWLVFRLGAHTMCASTLDVEGIIEPKPTTPLPFTPEHVLGTFMFRGHVATAVSLRKKLRVREGKDSAKGPFIVARIGDELAAFWVDEVKDVMGEHNVAWQPMPDMLQSRVFDCYTLAREELVLHTSFASLLAADIEGIPERWRARPEEDSPGEIAGVAGVAGAQAAAADSPGRGPEPSAEETAASSPPESASAEPDAAAAVEPPETRDPGDAPKDTHPTALAGGTARAVPPSGNRPVTGTRRGATPGIGSSAKPTYAPRGPEAEPRARAAWTNADLERRERRRRIVETSGHIASTRSEAAPRGGFGATGESDTETNFSSRPDIGFERREYQAPYASARTDERAGSDDAGPRKSRSRVAAGVALAAIAVLVAIFALWPDRRTEAPPERADNRAQGPVVAEPAPQPAAPSALPEPASRPAVAEKPVDATRVATVETDTLTLTIERPAKPAARTRGTGAAAPAPASAGGQASPGTIVHVVVRGDTLWHISKKYLGNPFRYPELVRLSGIRNPNLIHPGDVVRIRVNENRR